MKTDICGNEIESDIEVPFTWIGLFSFLAIFCLVLSLPAHAERLVNINLIVVEHPTSASAADQIWLFEQGISRLTEVGIKPRIIKIDIVPDLYNVNTVEQIYSRLYTWAEYGKKQKFKGIVFYSLPPMTAGVSSYAAGQAGAICVFTRNKKKKFAEGSLLVKNYRGFDRQPQARIVALHEMLHLVGANHIDRKGFDDLPNVMHPNAQAYATIPNLPILNLTKKQVRWCKQGKNVLGKKI